MLEELKHISPHGLSNIMDIEPISGAKGCSQRPLMGHSQPQQSINTKTMRNELTKLKLGDSTDASSTGCNIRE